ncbi:acetyl-CoA hydrolase/transferase C-terminal domain-containing protein [Henriciella litoralis]|uniref:acetyl-CoA hydrolase/transferase C-terminal domain-containing protein n=1 Tax=Henriciella litoralis TaxID=568102 RepID=UPI000A033287|nr:acetyl-CoA hydrolase/transferase C-terminal domain-containing protein [Henriciella litoralis]
MTNDSSLRSTEERPIWPSAEDCAQDVVNRIGKDIRLALPLGLGKANRFTNALYAMAKADPDIKLKIYTALSIIRPALPGGLGGRFARPLIEKFFGDYPDLDYAVDRQQGRLPPNVEIEEFFLATGTLLGNEYAQRHYNSVNYTHAMRRIVAERVNVLGQMVAFRDGRFSLACNSDLSLDLIPLMRKKVGRENFIVVGELNERLPFMPNDAEVPADEFDVLLECGGYDLAGPPAPRVDTVSYAIGMRAARLVKDGGTLQIGIGSLGDGAAQSVRLRHTEPDAFRAAVNALPGPAGPVDEGGDDAFVSGLYGCTEMFTQGMFELLRAGVFRRRAHKGREITVDGGFYLGPQTFYRGLRDAPDEVLNRVNMTSVDDVNALYGNEAVRRQERVDARFINIAMKATCLGAVTSDALEDGRVVSGVGGQYNFVAQAHELEDARSIILLKAVRETASGIESNLVWNYGHVTVPRHLRDIIITEYGVADLRGQPDEECVRRMLAITDARFLDGLVKDAIAAKKLPDDFVVPAEWRRNTPEAITTALHPFADILPAFPFGTEMDAVEQDLALALEHLQLQTANWGGRFRYALKALASPPEFERFNAHLVRLDLNKASTLEDRLTRRLVVQSLKDTHSTAGATMKNSTA